MNLVNTDIEYKKLGDICILLPKSERPVSYGKEKGLYPFYITPGKKKLYCDNADYNEEAIIISKHCIPGNNVNIKLSKCFSCSEHNFIIKINNQNTNYIYYWLVQNIQTINNLCCGTMINILSKEKLLNIKLPIPSLEVQARMVTEYNNLINIIQTNY
tara:strand:+ start:240 stop:713 length:474 start_codon:yes stop_codon:yes gene_type:complete